MILDEIAAKTKERIRIRKEQVPLEEVKKAAFERRKKEEREGRESFRFQKALKEQGISFICEVKKASPSKGVIAECFPYLDIAREYEEAGASALSVLTEPFYFQGSNEILQEIEQQVRIPILRKDFTVDEYMVYEAKAMGASAVLLICAILDDQQLVRYQKIARELGMDALVEAHTGEEVNRALKSGAGIIGVNNRDLKTFTVDIDTSRRLRKLVPDHVLYVSESGIKTPEDVRHLKENGTDGVLIGETFMRSGNKKEMLEKLAGRQEV